MLSAIETSKGRLAATLPVHQAGPLAIAQTLWGVDLVEPAADCSVSSVEPESLRVLASVSVPCGAFGLPAQLASTSDAVWYAPLGTTLTRIDAATGATSTFDLPVSGGLLSATDSTVFYRDAGNFYSMPSGGGAFTLVASIASFQSGIPGGEGVWLADGGQANLIVNGQPVESMPLPEGSRIVAADSGGVYVETSLVGSSELYRVAIDGGSPTLMARVTDLATESGSVSLDYGPEDGSPLVLSESELVRVWLVPSVAAPGTTSIAIQSAEIP
jgi:hypothetical protein